MTQHPTPTQLAFRSLKIFLESQLPTDDSAWKELKLIEKACNSQGSLLAALNMILKGKDENGGELTSMSFRMIAANALDKVLLANGDK